MPKIVGWSKVHDSKVASAGHSVFGKWRRERDNAFLEIWDATEHGFSVVDGSGERFVAVLWSGGASRPQAVNQVGSHSSVGSARTAAVAWMRRNP